MLQLKITDQTQNVFIFSDPHYNHNNICRGTSSWDLSKLDDNTTRDYPDLATMNKIIVDNINSTVKENDILICLGDWAFGGVDSISIFRNQINCKTIHLVTGNHDHHIVNNKNDVRNLFTTVNEYYTFLDLRFYSTGKFSTVKKYRIILSHFPIASWHAMSDGVIHLFGHVHLPSHYKIMQGRSMDVGMDGNNLTPYNIKECIELVGSNPILPTVLPKDHHSN